MDPASYYYTSFQSHFDAFWRSLEMVGSCSRARAHQQEDFWGYHLGSPISFVLKSVGGYFSIGDLIASPDRGLPDHLAEIPKGEQVDWLCALFYTVLIDQVMYTHRHADYAAFHEATQYPKMDRTIGWARTMTMANPYEIFGDEVLVSRGLREKDICDRFGPWADFIATDLQRFFSEHTMGTTTWPAVRDAMLADQDCTWGTCGSILRQRLLEEHADP
jgi:hypothetical protein